MLNIKNIIKIAAFLVVISFLVPTQVLAQETTASNNRDEVIAGSDPSSPSNTYNYNYSDSKCAAKSGGNIFHHLACKASATLGDLRKIIYVLAGFGLIAFAFAAIFGKVSFKHLAQIAASLFLVAMMSPFIEYFTGSGESTLKYGDFLPTNYAGIVGNDLTQVDPELQKAQEERIAAIEKEAEVVQNNLQKAQAASDALEINYVSSSFVNYAGYGENSPFIDYTNQTGPYTVGSLLKDIDNGVKAYDNVQNFGRDIKGTVNAIGNAISSGSVSGTGTNIAALGGLIHAGVNSTAGSLGVQGTQKGGLLDTLNSVGNVAGDVGNGYSSGSAVGNSVSSRTGIGGLGKATGVLGGLDALGKASSQSGQ